MTTTIIEGPGIEGPGIEGARIEGPGAWRRGDLHPEDYRVVLSPACLDEIRRAADELREFALPTIVRLPDEFDLPHCRAAMAEVRRMLDSGVRFASSTACRSPSSAPTARSGSIGSCRRWSPARSRKASTAS